MLKFILLIILFYFFYLIFIRPLIIGYREQGKVSEKSRIKVNHIPNDHQNRFTGGDYIDYEEVNERD